jgi:predicted ATPase
VGDGTVPPPGVCAGRVDEVEGLLGVLTGAAAGRFAMALVRGEAGVGKTTPTGVVTGLVADHMNVVSGACLPLTSLSVPSGIASGRLRRQVRSRI